MRARRWTSLRLRITLRSRVRLIAHLSLRFRPARDNSVAIDRVLLADHALDRQRLTFMAATRPGLLGLGAVYRRGGYRDPESQVFIESRSRYPTASPHTQPPRRPAPSEHLIA